MTDIRKKLAGKTSKLAQDRPRQDDHPANLNGEQEGSFYHIEIGLIHPDLEQPRKYFNKEALIDLTNSIQSKGVLQPVIIRKTDEGQIFLVAGERRFRAAKMAGLEKIPALLTKGDPLEISIVENLQRENLNPVEEAEALSKMIEYHGYTQEKLAFAIGKAKSTISETISINRLPESIKEEVRRAEQYPRRLLVEIAKQATTDAMIALFKQAKEGNLKSDEVRNIARKRTETTILRTPVEIASNRAQALNAFLDRINYQTIKQEERESLVADLKTLKDKIERLFVFLYK